MPAYTPGKTPWYGWLALSAIACGAAGLIFAHPLGVLDFVLVLTPFVIVGIRIRQGRIARLIESRRDNSICEFARSFDARVVDPWIIRATFEQIQGHLSKDDAIGIRATDDLTKVLCIDPEELDLDIAAEIAQRAGRSMENAERNPHFGRVKLVRDLVYFFNEQPKKAT